MCLFRVYLDLADLSASARDSGHGMAPMEPGCDTCPVCFAADTALELRDAQAEIGLLRTQLAASRDECASLRCAVLIMQQGEDGLQRHGKCAQDRRRVVPLVETDLSAQSRYEGKCAALLQSSVWGSPQETPLACTEREESTVLACVVAFLERAPSQKSHCAIVGNHLAYKMPEVYAKVKLKYGGLKEFVHVHRCYFTYTADSNTTVGTIHLRSTRADW